MLKNSAYSSIVRFNILYKLDQVDKSVVKLFYVSADFLFCCFINYWLSCIEIFECYSYFVSFFFQFFPFLPHVFWCSVITYVHLYLLCLFLVYWLFYSYSHMCNIFYLLEKHCFETCFKIMKGNLQLCTHYSSVKCS